MRGGRGGGGTPSSENVSPLPECQERRRQAQKHKKVSVFFSTSESPGKRSYGNQNLWSAKAEREYRPGRLDIDSQEEAWPQQFVTGNDEAELELSVESRSYVNRLNDQVRKRQERISNDTENGEKHSMIW